MDSQFPGVSEGFDGLRLLGQVLVAAVPHVPLIDEGWKLEP